MTSDQGTPARARVWPVRGVPPHVSEAINSLGKARGWSVAETLEHMLAFVEEAQAAPPNARVTALLRRHGLEYVQR